MRFLTLLTLSALLAPLTTVHAVPPTAPEARKLYDHVRGWLINFPASYIATNLRGANDKQYVERRMAALDLLREKRDFGTVYDLMVELHNGSFLDEPIIDLLTEWKAKRAIPVLERVANDRKRSKAVRKKAAAAIETMKNAKVEAPPKFY
jgi:hypothetical protein